MKILHIHTSMSAGGIQSVICSLANEMSRVGENVTVCSISQPKESDVFWEKLNHGIKRITLGKSGGGFSVSILFKIAKMIYRESFDVVHIHGFFCYYILAILFLHNRSKFFYTFHSDAFMENGKWDKRMLLLKKYCIRKQWIHPCTISDASNDSFRKLYGLDGSLIYNGIPRPNIPEDSIKVVDKYKKTSNTKVFLHVGRIDIPKNQKVLCNVFTRLIEEGCDVVLLIAGGITDKAIYNDIKIFFSDRIVYLGERKDVPVLLSQSDAMCLPSIWEGLPLVMLEAMAVGCVPICSPVGGIVNVIDDMETGILSRSSNEIDYYDSISRYLSLNADEIDSIRNKTKAAFDKYTVETMAANYLNIYYK